MISWKAPVEEPRPRDGLPAFAQRQGSPSAARLVGELPILLAVAALFAFLLKATLAQAFYIPSESMGCAECPVHTLEINDRVVVSKLSYRLHAPRRGDIVVFDEPAGLATPSTDRPNPIVRVFRWLGEGVGIVQPSTEDYIKRVIALPGEVVEGRDGQVYVDGRRLFEPYLPPGIETRDFGPIAVPEGRYWVMGDYRSNSNDSIVFGAIPRDTIVGRAVIRIWPLDRAAFL